MAGDFVKILYGTTNQAKLQAMRSAAEALGISLIGLNDIKSEIPKVNECGKTPLENAEIKAKAYYERLVCLYFPVTAAFTLTN